VFALTAVLDPEGAHLAALRRLGDFRDLRVLELGCGDGRLSLPIAAEAASVVAFDPDADEIGKAQAALPPKLHSRVSYRVASGQEIELEPRSFELALFSWSL
jgi:2-polyprenyl-3-methyl-5-hydroxy-6-metoxy-1,4-benzoquinol methylase